MTTTHTADNGRVSPDGRSARTLLFDTNVWLDYYLGRSGVASDIAHVIEYVRAGGDTIITTVSIKKDVFYIVPRELRRLAHAQDPGSPVPSGDSFTQIAWAVLESMDDIATVVPLSMREDFFARHLRRECDDYEDNALLATAHSAGAQIVVTSDRRLLERFGDRCQTPAAVLATYEAASVSAPT